VWEDVEQDGAEVELDFLEGARQPEVVRVGEADDQLVPAGQRGQLQRLPVLPAVDLMKTVSAEIYGMDKTKT
jgi:hypothetical protein